MNTIKALLTPHWAGDTVGRMEIALSLEETVKPGEPLMMIYTRVPQKVFCRMDGDFSFSDAQGSLTCMVEESDMGHVAVKSFVSEREIAGPISVTYALLPEAAGVNPVFDLGQESGGLMGSGMCFMPRFPEGAYHFVVDWDLSDMPAGCIGAWAFGMGHAESDGRETTLQETFYAVGQLDCVRLGSFSYYWFKNDTILENAVATAKIFAGECAFFHDDGQPYSIFTRHARESQRAGGTALTRSYGYIYRDNSQLDPAWLKFLFAHEMVHNWVHLNDEPFGTCTWYVEGMAEYYSALLAWRMGVVTCEELLFELNKRARSYYENPAIHCTNQECGASLMKDPERTRVPYGRGFFYLMHADGMIRKATNGEKCLDDVMLCLNAIFAENPKAKNEAWIAEYGKYVGEETAAQELEALAGGEVVVPDAACYENAVTLVKTEGKVRGTDENCVVYQFE